jgi:hypothetical protein
VQPAGEAGRGAPGGERQGDPRAADGPTVTHQPAAAAAASPKKHDKKVPRKREASHQHHMSGYGYGYTPPPPLPPPPDEETGDFADLTQLDHVEQAGDEGCCPP